MTSTQTGQRVVALGGGHGLAVSLTALRKLTDQLTAIVTVADDGGSSGRLRREFGCLPPGDLRMALAALCGDDVWGRTWRDVVQHRFDGTGELHGHALGNLLIVALWEQFDGDPVEGLGWLARLLGCTGVVIPMSTQPLQIVAHVRPRPQSPETVVVRGQHQVATTPGSVERVFLEPPDPPACHQAVAAVKDADWLVLGPGSWFSSVIPHLLVPDLAASIVGSRARRVLVLNLGAELGETADFTPEAHLQSLRRHAPELGVDVVLVDAASVVDPAGLADAAAAYGARVVIANLRSKGHALRHDSDLLSAALAEVFEQQEPGERASVPLSRS